MRLKGTSGGHFVQHSEAGPPRFPRTSNTSIREIQQPPLAAFAQTLNYLCGLSLDFLQYVHISLVLRSPELDPVLRRGPIRAEQKRRITPLDFLAILSLMQARIPFAAFAVKTHGWLILVH